MVRRGWRRRGLQLLLRRLGGDHRGGGGGAAVSERRRAHRAPAPGPGTRGGPGRAAPAREAVGTACDATAAAQPSAHSFLSSSS
jgi:hypothetical protein